MAAGTPLLTLPGLAFACSRGAHYTGTGLARGPDGLHRRVRRSPLRACLAGPAAGFEDP